MTLRVRAGLPSVRTGKFLGALREVLASSIRLGLRVVHYSVERDHVHLLVEARSKRCLERGMKSLGAGIARAASRVFGRKGNVLDGRYHHRVLCTPLEVRRALAYVLPNTNPFRSTMRALVVTARAGAV